MDAESVAIYNMKENEISENTWIAEINITFKFDGSYSPIGPINDQWIDNLYQGSPIGFLMTKDGNTYTFQSRYNTANGLSN
jgi:hypothetical protein